MPQPYPFQPIISAAQICVAQGLSTVVLSPGSRNAPLVLAFARHPAMVSVADLGLSGHAGVLSGRRLFQFSELGCNHRQGSARSGRCLP